MATFNFVPDFYEALFEKVHNFATDNITVALSNTAPSSETSDPTTSGNGVLANVTEIAYTNLSTRVLTLSSSDESGGTYSAIFNDITLSTTGGSTGPFRYVYIYNDSATNDELIGYYDYGSSVTLLDGEGLTIDLDNVNGLIQAS